MKKEKENIKEKIYDFGELGEWSESTLMRQVMFSYDMQGKGGYRYSHFAEIDFIEKKYKESISKYIEQIKIIKNKRAWFHKISWILRQANLYETLNKMKKDLDKNYRKYIDTMIVLFKNELEELIS